MNIVKIKDLGKVVTGKTPPSVHPEYFGGSLPFLTPTDMQHSRRTVTARSISPEGVDRFKRSILPAKSTAFVCIGATIGKVTQVEVPTLTNQQINSVIPNKEMDPDYVYYLLLFNKDKVVQVASGAATPIVNKTVFENIELEIHPPNEQKAISEILSAYDDLIYVNSRRVEKLEALSRLLYHQYFNVRESADWPTLTLDKIISSHIGGGWGADDSEGSFTEPAYVIRGTDIPSAKRGDVESVPFRFHKPSNLRSRSLEADDIIFEVSGGSKGLRCAR